MNINIIQTSPSVVPTRATEGSSGYDLYSTEDVFLGPLERVLVGTGISVEMGIGIEAQVRPRSGLAIKHGITVLNTPGTIDADYKEEIKVVLINLSNNLVKLPKHTRIAQLVFAKVELPNLVIVSTFQERIGGFGSTH